jgi:hypothetical protein
MPPVGLQWRPSLSRSSGICSKRQVSIQFRKATQALRADERRLTSVVLVAPAREAGGSSAAEAGVLS